MHTELNAQSNTAVLELTSCVEHSKHLLSPVGTGVWTYLHTGQLRITHTFIDVIFQLLLVKHRYARLPMFSSEKVDFMIQFLCTK